ncbi:MAG: beta-propeller fold lactonase family protein, partial [Mycobacterium sp.]
MSAAADAAVGIAMGAAPDNLASLLGGAPVSPVAAPLAWAVAAVARRQLGAESTARPDAVATVSTGQSLTTAVAAAAAPNLPPVIGAPTFGTPNPTTGAVVGQVVAADPENKALSYTLITAPEQGTLVLDKKSGAFTYTPIGAQRVLAGSSAGPDTVTMTVTVSDGVKANNKVATVAIPIAAVPVTTLKAVDTGDYPHGLAVTNDRAYVANYISGTVTVINTLDGTVVGNPITVGSAPIAVVVSIDGKRVYVANSGVNGALGSLSVIDTATLTVVGNPISLGHNPSDVAISRDGKSVFVANYADGTISKIATATLKVSSVKVAANPYAITVSADGKKVYVVNQNTATGDGSVTVYSSSITGAKVIETGVQHATAVAVGPDNSRVAILHADGTVRVLETSKYTQVANFDAGSVSYDALYNADGTVLAVARTDGTLALFDATAGYGPAATVTYAQGRPFVPQLALSP